ncbi:SAM domain containing protein [Musa troglodytarum]|uniref:SAM domain containing protein n=1 Tax=Musa troglodytarum TaxID=320322 RepID=A0A9E7KTW6_9LILI|nr:SAM domain containing protein [Musa troglodytarum]
MSARPQFTITLGRSGQVVKRARPIVDGSHSDDDMPSFGGKRSVRERLESNTANYNSYRRQYENKRQRTDGLDSRFIDKNMRDKQIKTNHRVGRDDLRWKLMKKSLSRRNLDAEGQRDVDLREKLSRNVQASSRSDSRQHATESSTSGLGRRIPSTRSADDLLELDAHRKSYSWTSDRQRLGSPDRFISTQRHMSPSRRYEELRHASAIRSIDASRPSSFLTNSGIGDASRSLNFMAKDISVSAKPVVRAPAPGIIGPRSVLKPEEPLTVASLLHSLGLGKYAILFQAEEVDMTALRQMGDSDLKELGIPMMTKPAFLGVNRMLCVEQEKDSKPRRRRCFLSELAKVFR